MTNKYQIAAILLSSLLLYFLAGLFSYIGLLLSMDVFYALFGEPYELGWFLLYAIAGVAAIVFGIFGSLVGVIITRRALLKAKNKLGTTKHPILKTVGLAYLIFIGLTLITIMVAGELIPECPGCMP